MKNLIFCVSLFLFVCSFDTFAKESCGEFTGSGIVKQIEDDYYLVLNFMTMSEFKIKFEDSQVGLISPFKNLKISSGLFVVIKDDRSKEIYGLKNLSASTLNSLGKSDHLKFLKEVKCNEKN